MEIAEKDRDGQKKEVDRIADVVAQEFNKFAHQHPAHENCKPESSSLIVPRPCRFEVKVDKQKIPGKGPVGNCG